MGYISTTCIHASSKFKKNNKSSSVYCIMYWTSLQNIMHLFALITRCFLFPLLELAAILTVLFSNSIVACQLERLLPSGHTWLETSRCNLHITQVSTYIETLLQSTFPLQKWHYSPHTIVLLQIIDFFASLRLQFSLCRAKSSLSPTKLSCNNALNLELWDIFIFW